MTLNHYIRGIPSFSALKEKIPALKCTSQESLLGSECQSYRALKHTAMLLTELVFPHSMTYNFFVGFLGHGEKATVCPPKIYYVTEKCKCCD